VLKLTAGLRWSHEEKRARVTYVRPRPLCSAVLGTCPVTGNNPSLPAERNGFADKRSWSAFSPRLSLDWEIAEETLLWGGWSRGRRSGGYNLRITQPAAFEQLAALLGTPAYAPERVDGFELGLKWQGLDRRIGVMATLFQNEVADLQREINVPSPSSGLAQSIFNTADARIRGGEMEIIALPAQGLQLSASLGYLDARYTRVRFDINSDGTISAADRALKLPRAPKWTWGFAADYELELAGEATLSARASFQHRSRFAYTDNNWGFNAASDTVDANLTLDLGKPAIRLALFGRNLLDEAQFGGDTQLPFAGGPGIERAVVAVRERPAAGTFSPLAKGRTVGVEVSLAL
jgi:iron complex outermembrane recepter protein